jgi:nucleoside-diphosphate-sugar epimerase
MKSVLITHADLPLGRRIAKVLWHDPTVSRILALGEGAIPRAFNSYRDGAPPRFVYERIDLARQRSVSELFRSKRMRLLGVDSVVYVPRHGAAPEGAPVVAKIPARTAEARLVLHHAQESRSIRSLIALGSAFVYKLAPCHANQLTERSELDFDPEVAPELRSWIDSDMLFNAEFASARLRVLLLRVPTVVASGGFVYLHPGLEGTAGLRVRPAGFDPLCSVISDKDVARAVRTALHTDMTGVFNVAAREVVPLSVLGRWTRRPCIPVPGPLLAIASGAVAQFGGERLRGRLEGPYLRYGMCLDTRRAAEELGFTPRYRVGVARAGDGVMRVEAVAI